VSAGAYLDVVAYASVVKAVVDSYDIFVNWEQQL
jgi:hypothetical protein